MFIFHKETTLQDLGNGVSRRILAHDGKMMAVEVNFDAGAVGPMHCHPHEQLTYVLSGEFEFTIGEETRRVSAGEGDAEDGVGAEAGLVGRAVELDEELVDGGLVGGVEAEQVQLVHSKVTVLSS